MRSTKQSVGIKEKKSADTEKHGIGTFWAFFDFTLTDSLDMIKIETVFTGYRGEGVCTKEDFTIK